MPAMDGFELTHAIRKMEMSSSKRLPIVAITANALQGEADHCLAAGMDDYLSKPVELKKFKAVLERWLPASTAFDIEASSPFSPGPSIKIQQQEPVRLQESAITSAIQKEVLESFLGDDAQIQQQFLQKFTTHSEAIVAAALSAVENGDFLSAGDQAHKLKSSAHAVGAMTLSQLCASLEQAAHRADSGECEALAEQVHGEFERVCDYVNALN